GQRRGHRELNEGLPQAGHGRGGARPAADQPRVPRGRVHGHHGGQRVGQEHADEHHRLPRQADQRAVHPRRRGRRVFARRRAERDPQRADRVHLPTVQPDPAADGAREPRGADVLPRRPAEGAAAAGDGAGRAGRHAGAVRPPPDATLRRPAAAGVHRPRADQRPADPAGRRADRRARQQDRPADPRPVRRAGGAGEDDRDRHPRPDRGPPVPADHRAARRPGGAGRAEPRPGPAGRERAVRRDL
ncbi:MAG: ABC-type antimicrobial peptide transport system, ATPase component, partial [uncultured Phycisphaerae bacterium]